MFDAASAMPSTNPRDPAPDFNTLVKNAGNAESTISDEKSLKRLVSPRKKMFLGNPNHMLGRAARPEAQREHEREYEEECAPPEQRIRHEAELEEDALCTIGRSRRRRGRERRTDPPLQSAGL